MGKIYEELRKRKKMLCHVTEYENIESILKNGLLSLREVHRKGMDVKYLSTEKSRSIDCNCRMDDFVRLAYTPYYDMIPANIYYEKLENPEAVLYRNPVIICIHPDILMEKKGIRFSDKNAVASDANIYSNEDDVYSHIDFEKTYEIRNGSNAGSEEYKNARQAEVLIPHIIEKKYIKRIVVDEEMDISPLLGYGIDIQQYPIKKCYNL